MKKAFIYILMALMLVFSVMAAPEFSVFPSDETVEVGEEYNALIDVEFDGPVLLTIVGVPDGMSMSQVPNDDGNSATLEWTPSVDQNGDSFDIELTACEFYYDMDDEDCVTHEFTLTVEGGFIVAEPVFNPLFDDTNPYITTEAVTSVLLGETYEYDVNALDLDGNDGLSLVYSLSTYPTDMTMDSEGLIQWTPTELGDFDVVVEVEDNDGNVVTQEFTITVTENNAPVITEIADQTATEGDAFSLTGDATDDDVVTFTLSVVDADSNDVSADFTLTDNGDNTFTIDYTAVEGVYTVTVTADDGEYTDTEEFVLTVSAASTNNVPVITEIADQNVDVGSDFSLSGSATDADGDVVSFSISVLNADSVDVTSDFTFTDDGDNTFDISMSSAVEGVYTVTVTADDANGGVDTEEFTLTVESL